MDRRAFLALGASLAAIPARPFAQPSSGLPSDDAVRQILARRIDQERQSVGVVCGLIDANGSRIISHGRMTKGGAPVGPNSVYEIGSISKVFTCLILADMIQRGEVRLDQPIAGLLPAGVKVPSRGGRQITLIDLATHTSGLPRMPSNFSPKDQTNPYTDYTVEQLYAFLADFALPRDIGGVGEYSNLGMGLLGHALALTAGKSYEALLKERITVPLGMADTTVALTPALQTRLATGHDRWLDPAANWDLPTLAGAGGIRSTAVDMLKLLAAELGFVETPLQAAMTAQLQPRRNAGEGVAIALGWVAQPTAGGGEIIWHNGGTGGYRSYTGFDLKRQIGVILLSNTQTEAGMNDIGAHLLTGSALGSFKAPQTRVALDPARSAAWAGAYRNGEQQMVVTSEEGRLYAEIIGQGRNEVFRSGPDAIFWKVVEATADFETGPTGAVETMVSHRDGRDTTWRRIR